MGQNGRSSGSLVHYKIATFIVGRVTASDRLDDPFST